MSRVRVVRDLYHAYETGDRALVERLMSDDVVGTYEATRTDGGRFRRPQAGGVPC